LRSARDIGAVSACLRTAGIGCHRRAFLRHRRERRNESMITVVGSLKGGSGKSTVTFNLAVWLTLADVPVRIVDLDPQKTLHDVVDLRREDGYQPALAVHNGVDMQRSIAAPEGETLVDVGTANMDAFRQAVRVADRILVPVPPSQADIWSTQRFLAMLDDLVEGAKRPEVVAFINRADTHHAVTESDETAAALVALRNLRFVKRRLAQRTVYRRSFSEGMAVFELDPRGKAAREFVSLAAALYPQHTRA